MRDAKQERLVTVHLHLHRDREQSLALVTRDVGSLGGMTDRPLYTGLKPQVFPGSRHSVGALLLILPGNSFPPANLNVSIRPREQSPLSRREVARGASAA
ncbi:hypothetical protein DPSP01_001858 [Paraphaeosphaeria sporulosa]